MRTRTLTNECSRERPPWLPPARYFFQKFARLFCYQLISNYFPSTISTNRIFKAKRSKKKLGIASVYVACEVWRRIDNTRRICICWSCDVISQILSKNWYKFYATFKESSLFHVNTKLTMFRRKRKSPNMSVCPLCY